LIKAANRPAANTPPRKIGGDTNLWQAAHAPDQIAKSPLSLAPLTRRVKRRRDLGGGHDSGISPMHIVAGLFALAAAAIVAVWAWLGAQVDMPQVPLGAGGKLDCLSYAPFRGDQNPLEPGTHVEPWQINQDLAQLKPLTDCIRTYSIDHGLDRIPEIARKHGIKVLHGLWLSSQPELNRRQIETTIILAKQFPDVIEAIIVGNEVLLRGEMSATDLARTIREVKAKVSMPVSYADVWEFWLRHRDVAQAVDFITIHVLPYWEDVPIPAAQAARHVDAIRNQMIAAFPGKEVFLGEFGWPSAGRMREGALPSPINAARTMHEVIAQGRRAHYRVNLIEAYDQPWKRKLEGTVGGHWGLFEAYKRRPKFVWGASVSNHPNWRWYAAAGVAFAALVFTAALAACWLRPSPPARVWLAVTANAAISGTLFGWTIKNVPIESLTVGDWIRSLAWAIVAIGAPIVGAAAATSGVRPPRFGRMLGRRTGVPTSTLAFALGALLIVLVVLAVQAALGLVFNPRYRDFPFTALTAATVPNLLLMTSWPRARQIRPDAESVAAGTLMLCAIVIVFNETFANWQALWFGAGLCALAVSLLWVRDAPGSG
jgi:glucan 1,3-beta-glucosidase